MDSNSTVINKEVKKFYDRFVKNKNINSNIDDIASLSAHLSYQASIKRALYEKGVAVGFKGLDNEKEINRKKGEEYITEMLLKLYNMKNKNEIRSLIYESWDKIKSIYTKNKITWYTYGNAQKWVNMSIKYFIVICIVNGINIKNLYDDCLFPVDGVMIKKIMKQWNIKFKDKSWSMCNNKKVFENYINEIENKVIGSQFTNLFEFEVLLWQ